MTQSVYIIIFRAGEILLPIGSYQIKNTILVRYVSGLTINR